MSVFTVTHPVDLAARHGWRKAGPNSWRTPHYCAGERDFPKRSGGNPGLSVRVGRDGGLQVKCFYGCDNKDAWAAVMDAIGVQRRRPGPAFVKTTPKPEPSRRMPRWQEPSYQPPAGVVLIDGTGWPMLRDERRSYSDLLDEIPGVWTAWTAYTLADGQPRKQIRNFPHVDGQPKSKWDGDVGRPTAGMTPARWTTGPWSSHTHAVIVEGEKAAAALMSAGVGEYADVFSVSSTSGMQGADYVSFSGRPVIVWPDADDPTRRREQSYARARKRGRTDAQARIIAERTPGAGQAAAAEAVAALHRVGAGTVTQVSINAVLQRLPAGAKMAGADAADLLPQDVLAVLQKAGLKHENRQSGQIGVNGKFAPPGALNANSPTLGFWPWILDWPDGPDPRAPGQFPSLPAEQSPTDGDDVYNCPSPKWRHRSRHVTGGVRTTHTPCNGCYTCQSRAIRNHERRYGRAWELLEEQDRPHTLETVHRSMDDAARERTLRHKARAAACSDIAEQATGLYRLRTVYLHVSERTLAAARRRQPDVVVEAGAPTAEDWAAGLDGRRRIDDVNTVSYSRWPAPGWLREEAPTGYGYSDGRGEKLPHQVMKTPPRVIDQPRRAWEYERERKKDPRRVAYEDAVGWRLPEAMVRAGPAWPDLAAAIYAATGDERHALISGFRREYTDDPSRYTGMPSRLIEHAAAAAMGVMPDGPLLAEDWGALLAHAAYQSEPGEWDR